MALPDFAIANAVLAVPLALMAMVGSLMRRPAVAHALWLLVLLRLFAPPLWRVPLPEWPTSPVPAIESSVSAPVGSDAEAEWVGPADPARELIETAVHTPAPELVRSPVIYAPTINWRSGVAGIWSAGAIAILGLAIKRGTAFSRLLRHAKPAPAAWQLSCDRLAQRLGLRRGPKVWLVRGPVSPLLWAGFGRPRVLLPADLAERLDGARRAALLAHELAHVRRGDHWVRWLELAATAMYWWHPAVWLARWGLREAEEQCCDAWVVWALPAGRRAYADALVDTVDFLSCARPVLPPLASGLGTVRHLQRRVVMIMRGKVAPRLSRPGLLVGLAMGVVLLAISPSWGQPDDDKRPPEPRPGASASGEPRRPPPTDEADELRQTIRQLRAKLDAAEARLTAVEGRSGPQREGRRRPPGGLPPEDPRVPRRPDQPADPTAPSLPLPPAPPQPPQALYPQPGAAPIFRTPAQVPTTPAVVGEDAATIKQDRRMRELERDLAALRREIVEMRREMRRLEPPAP